MQSRQPAAADAEYRDCSPHLLRYRATGSKMPRMRVQVTPLPRALKPNPSLKRSHNGKPPGPSHGYGVHFPCLGPGGLPSCPA